MSNTETPETRLSRLEHLVDGVVVVKVASDDEKGASYKKLVVIDQDGEWDIPAEKMLLALRSLQKQVQDLQALVKKMQADGK